MPNDPPLDALRSIAAEAGEAVLALYGARGELAVDAKEDGSPLTEADRRADRIIAEGLARLSPRLPVLSEESAHAPAAERRRWERYWLVDPLDGTREFIGGSGEFTVNIALIDRGAPVAGAVHAPVSGATYLGGLGAGAFKRCGRDRTVLRCRPLDAARVRVAASRGHGGPRTEGLIRAIGEAVGPAEVVRMGSSLKICLLAEGAADIYPRLGPTSEWDTAAAHAVLLAAGGEIVDAGFKPLRYNRGEGLANPDFLALADPAWRWRDALGPALA